MHAISPQSKLEIPQKSDTVLASTGCLGSNISPKVDGGKLDGSQTGNRFFMITNQSVLGDQGEVAPI